MAGVWGWQGQWQQQSGVRGYKVKLRGPLQWHYTPLCVGGEGWMGGLYICVHMYMVADVSMVCF